MSRFRITLHSALARRFSRSASSRGRIKGLSRKHLRGIKGKEHGIHGRSIKLEKIKPLHIVICVQIGRVVLRSLRVSDYFLEVGAGIYLYDLLLAIAGVDRIVI